MKKFSIVLALFLITPTFCLGGPYDPIVTTDYGDGTSATYDGPDLVSSTNTIGGSIVIYDYDNQE
jgi:hypothetical protein